MPDIFINRFGRMLKIGLDRAPVNSMSRAFSREVQAALERLQSDPDLSVGLIHCLQNKAFSAGWELKAAASGEKPGQRRVHRGILQFGWICGDHGILGSDQTGGRCHRRACHRRRVRDRHGPRRDRGVRPVPLLATQDAAWDHT